MSMILGRAPSTRKADFSLEQWQSRMRRHGPTQEDSRPTAGAFSARFTPRRTRFGQALCSALRALLFYVTVAAPAHAQTTFAPSGVTPIELSMPIDCTLGQDCFIQNYVDMDPGPGAKDFMCGPLAYDNHQGTDFRLRNRNALSRPYAALAAAPGTVVQVINNQPDHGFREGAFTSLDCGNAVMIDHGGGWMSQYCHLAEGSVTVQRGQQVQRSQPIGNIGSSGGTSFPHLHYAIRNNNATISPFTGVSPTGCDAAEAGPLWQNPGNIFYADSAILGFGVSSIEPTLERMENGTLNAPPSDPHAPVHVWAHIMGVQSGDTIRFTARAPNGNIIASERFPIPETGRIFSAGIGFAPQDSGVPFWPSGTYQAQLAFYRGGQEIGTRSSSFTFP